MPRESEMENGRGSGWLSRTHWEGVIMKTEAAWVIDAAYANLASRAVALNLDMLKLKRLLEEKVNGKKPLKEGLYLNSVAPEHQTESLNRFHTYLKSADGPQLKVELYGFKKQAHVCPCCKNSSYRSVQKGVDVAIAMRIIRLAEKYRQVILLAGDADFLDAIRYVKEKLNTNIVIAGFRGSISADLQSYADEVVWLDDYASLLKRESKIA